VRDMLRVFLLGVSVECVYCARVVCLNLVYVDTLCGLCVLCACVLCVACVCVCCVLWLF